MEPLITVEKINERLEATVNRLLEKHLFEALDEEFRCKIAVQANRIFTEFGVGHDILDVTVLEDGQGVRVYYRIDDYENTVEGRVSSA